jgi:thiamine-monophosphate kinase
MGIGDDAAVLAPVRGEAQVVTTDSLVEGVHFRREWTPASAIGHKALAVNLSDLAAMGARPHSALLSLALPAELPLDDFDTLIDGFAALAARARTTLVGGNITRSPGPLVVDVTVIGSIHPRRVLKRAGGRPGHELWVTGSIGGAASGLARLQAGAGDRRALDAQETTCLDRYERPEPRSVIGVQIARNRAAAAAIDLSDGLAEAVRQLSEASGTGAVLDAAAIPIEPGARRWAATTGGDAVSLALAGGEDYELLFAVTPKRRRAFEAVMKRHSPPGATRIGRLTAEPGCWVDGPDGRRVPSGFSHF